MKTFVAVLLGKAISYLSRYLKIGGGSAAPGLFALKIDGDLVRKITSQIPKNVIITGTNGKTTTARMLAHFAKTSRLKVIRNHTGSNLERGIASTLLQSSSVHLRGVKLNYALGIWELDEAAFNTVAPKIKPDYVVFLNVFRDQLDRYGEVDTVVKNWCESLKKLDKSTVVLVNGDDVNTSSLIKCLKGKVEKFGVKDYKIVGESIEHLKENEKLDYEAEDIKLNELNGSNFQLRIHRSSGQATNSELRTTLPLPGIYHIYDFLAAFGVGIKLGFSAKRMISSLKDFQPAFGRVEKISIKNNEFFIFLIKNPAGATQVFETVAPNIKKNDRILLALNDNLADGTDVSWIWDANFESLVKHKNSQKSASVPLRQRPASTRGESEASNTNTPQGCLLIASGTRAYDLANRLKYAGFDPNNIIVEPNLRKALQRAQRGLKGRLFILPTYTAMLELQRILTKMGIKRHYWEEDN